MQKLILFKINLLEIGLEKLNYNFLTKQSLRIAKIIIHYLKIFSMIETLFYFLIHLKI